MKINTIIKIFIAFLSIYLLSKYNFLDFNILLTLNFSLSIKLLGLISLIILLGSIKWYYLLKVQNNNISFKDALIKAQKLGYAESNPNSDIKGIDAAEKISILSSMFSFFMYSLVFFSS